MRVCSWLEGESFHYPNTRFSLSVRRKLTAVSDVGCSPLRGEIAGKRGHYDELRAHRASVRYRRQHSDFLSVTCV